MFMSQTEDKLIINFISLSFFFEKIINYHDL